MLQKITDLEQRRAEELAQHKASGGKGKPKFSRAGELTKLRGQLKAAEKPFNVDSYKQRVELVAGYLGLELPTGKERSTVTTDDKALEALLSRVKRGTLKPKNVSVEETLGILSGMVEAKKWAVWRRTFVDRTLRRVGYEVPTGGSSLGPETDEDYESGRAADGDIGRALGDAED